MLSWPQPSTGPGPCVETGRGWTEDWTLRPEHPGYLVLPLSVPTPFFLALPSHSPIPRGSLPLPANSIPSQAVRHLRLASLARFFLHFTSLSSSALIVRFVCCLDWGLQEGRLALGLAHHGRSERGCGAARGGGGTQILCAQVRVSGVGCAACHQRPAAPAAHLAGPSPVRQRVQTRRRVSIVLASGNVIATRWRRR